MENVVTQGMPIMQELKPMLLKLWETCKHIMTKFWEAVEQMQNIILAFLSKCLSK